MASLNDLFNKQTSDDKRPTPPKWNAPGDFHDIIVKGEPISEQQKEVGGSWEPLWLEKKPNGDWKPTKESLLTEGSERFEATQIVVFGKLYATGEDTVVYFDNKVKKAALEAAMQKCDLADGYGMRITRGPNNGRSYTWEVKIAPPKASTGA